ncbi:Methyltransferase-like protein 16 [Thelohanellus kitauei]|uniref:Methyltransferase-like protein 16 n=1 Tax=Thelohanellus kitauei TaxID=669202 RepID=A0A0C2M908_THEKT|nr:Methyltransferase-like protein 16 [Thelohanellus kitauei]
MHPRNPYKDGVDIGELAESYPDIKACYKKRSDSGKLYFDFEDAENAAVLTKYLMLHDFKIKIDLHPQRLLPHLPFRLNYIFWIEDLLTSEGVDLSSPLIGLDVGCGAACVYALISTSLHPMWKFYVSEDDPESREYCERNISSNRAEGQIILCNETDGLLLPLFMSLNETSKATFTMCNPPFFSKPMPGNEKKPFYSKHDRCTKGGEIHFVKKMIDESLKLDHSARTSCIWFTSVIGRKKSIQPLLNHIESHLPPIKTFRIGHSIQGEKTRWYIAWSFVASAVFSVKSSHVYTVKNMGKPIVDPNTHFQTFCRSLNEHLSDITESLNIETHENRAVYRISVDINIKKWSRDYRRSNIVNEDRPGYLTTFNFTCFIAEKRNDLEDTEIIVKFERSKTLDKLGIESLRNHIISYIRAM